MEMTRWLVVEGKQDFRVIDHLLSAHGIVTFPAGRDAERPFELKPQEGFDNLHKGVGVALKGSALTHLGIVVDADLIAPDTGLSGRWCSMRDLLRARGYDCPDRPDSSGIVLRQEDRPTVGLWVMPDNVRAGKLETLMADLVPPGSLLWDWAHQAIDEVPSCEERFDEKDREKALVHTYLAVQKQPGSPMGSAVRKRYFNANSELAVRFANWVRGVFELGNA